jgi:hypothetical protein
MRSFEQSTDDGMHISVMRGSAQISAVLPNSRARARARTRRAGGEPALARRANVRVMPSEAPTMDTC